MWFKNAQVYRLTEGWQLSAELLSEKLQEFAFQECGSLDPMKYGFTTPLGRHGTDFVHAANGRIMVCTKKQEKILPAGVINEQLEAKVIAISEAESRPVGRKERDSLKDEIIFSLLPKAFTRSSLTYAYIDPANNWIVVNASSAKAAEDLLSKLREALGSLRCLPVTPKGIPSQVMTHWLRESEAPPQFELGGEVHLVAHKDGSAVNGKKIDLTSSEVRNHLENGMCVSKVSLVWKECITFTVNDQLEIRGLKFDSAICDKANERNPESKAEQFDADFAIMALELGHFISALIAAFGGLSEADADLNIDSPAKPEGKAVDGACPTHETGQNDSLYAEAKQFCISQQKASISALQRYLRVGYNRAASLIEALEVDGVVSPADHSGGRKVLVKV